ncbi:MAG TPA: exopolyphosphatase [Acidimicrobiaceae bacterium]|nr:exopolyphosphatase [Acidimicrobiaceae bacterium]
MAELSRDGPSDGAPVAALDCGTNSTRLLVVDALGNTLDRQMRITRLGQDVDATGMLAAGAISRTVAVLGDYRATMDELGVRRARLAATSAVRDAANGERFLAAARAATGVQPELLSGDEEGRLSFAGATAALPPGFPTAGTVLVIDIGGGSTELAAGKAGVPGSVQVVSLDIGCVRVSERFLTDDPPAPSRLEEARLEVVRQLETARAELPPLEPGGPVIGLAGTVSTLAALELSLDHYDRDSLHHSRLEASSVHRWLDVLATEPADARLARPGMVEGRQDVIVGGVLVLAEVMVVFDRPWCLVSEDDILDGLVLSLRW